MKMVPITSQHLEIAQRIVSFVQEQGWDIHGMEIDRYNARENPFIDSQGEDWKGPKINWSLTIRVGPREDDEVVKSLKGSKVL